MVDWMGIFEATSDRFQEVDLTKVRPMTDEDIAWVQNEIDNHSFDEQDPLRVNVEELRDLINSAE